MSVCYFCGYEFDYGFKPGRNTECPECRKPVHCCKNCSFYKPGMKWDCSENISENVKDKESGNFCDYFVFGNSKSDGAGALKASDARKGFDNLFGNG